MNLLTKLKLLAQLNTTEKEVEEGIKMKNSTKIVAAVIALLTAIVQVPDVQAAIAHFIALHPAAATLLGGASALIALIHNPKATAAFVLAVAMTFAPHAQAQDAPVPNPISNLYAVGISYNPAATQPVAGSALYAHLVAADLGTYAFTAVDALPTAGQGEVANTAPNSGISLLQLGIPTSVTTNIGVGVAQKVFTLGKIPIFMPTAVGVSWTGSNTGWQWNGGAVAAIHIKGQYYVMPSVRFLKSSVSSRTGYQPILGVLFGWGQ